MAANISKKEFKLSPEHEELLTKYAKRLKKELDDLQQPDPVEVEIVTTMLRNLIEDESPNP